MKATKPNDMKTKMYFIEGETNPYIAQRDMNFNGKTRIIIESGLTLKEAQEKLLEMYNDDYDYEQPYRSSWREARRWDKNHTCNYGGGLFGYEFDSRYYRLKEHTENHITIDGKVYATEED